MKNLLNVFLILTLILSITVCDQSDMQFTQEGEESTQNQNMNSDHNYQNMRRTACLIFSRYFTNSLKEQVELILGGLQPEEQRHFINKLYAVQVEQCEPQISQSQVQQVYQQNSDFNPENIFHLFDKINLNSIKDNLAEQLSPNQQNIVKFSIDFDEKMKIRKEEEEAQKIKQQGTPSNQIKILGFSLKDIPQSVLIIYFLIFIGILGGILVYGISKISQKKQKAVNKRRKSPSKDKKQK